MAKYVHGINGPLVGRLGNLVASSWRNIPYLKTRPQRKKPFTPKELNNQHIFGMTTQWLSPLTDFLKAGFKGDDTRKWGFNGAKSYLHAHALVKEGDRKVVDPSKMLISQGHLPLGDGFEMHFDQQTAELTVRWNPNTPKVKEGVAAASDDKLMLAVYSPEVGEVWGEPYGVSRRVGVDRVEVEPGWITTYHVYVAFVAADGSNRSDSLYLGAFSVGKEEERGEDEPVDNERVKDMETERLSQRADARQRERSNRNSAAKQPKPALRVAILDTRERPITDQRWQSSTSSPQLYGYTFTYSYG